MRSSSIEIELPIARSVVVTKGALQVALADGRSISVPLAWYPRLLHATSSERRRWRLIGQGRGIHWEALDEDISIEGILAGRASGESRASFRKWLNSRAARQASRPIPLRRKRRAR